jgi:hypothetical protein
MAEELYFFKFNREAARKNLPDLLNIKDAISFHQYLIDHNDNEVTVDTIVRKAEENIEQLTISELEALFHWFAERIEHQGNNQDYAQHLQQHQQEMAQHGLDLFYEIPSKTPVRNYHHFMGDYETLTSQELTHQCSAHQLKQFLQYAICYTNELTLFLNIHYYHKEEMCEENLQIKEQLQTISQGNNYLYQLAQSKYKKELPYYQQVMQAIPQLAAFRNANKDKTSYTYPDYLTEIQEQESHLVNLAYQKYIGEEIIDKLVGYEGQVTILYSY